MARKGLPASIIKKYGVTKKAWRVYRGKKRAPRTKRKTTKKRKRTRRSNPKKGGNRTAKRKIPLVATLGAIGSLAVTTPWSGGNSVLSRLMQGNIEDAMKIAVRHYTGIDPYTGAWNIMEARGLMAVAGSAAISMIVSKLGLNRYLRDVPFIKL